MIIAGIDPGTTRIGYAILASAQKERRLHLIETISIPPHQSQGDRLLGIFEALTRRFRRDHVDGVALEKLFFSKNIKTALSVAEARGVILLTARKHVRSIWEYTPSEVKLALTGYGNADKESVRQMVRLLFPKAVLPKGEGADDAIDAAAIAITAGARELNIRSVILNAHKGRSG